MAQINKPNQYFEATTYAGGTTAITSLDFSPDLVWAKKTTGIENHGIFDSVRGVYQSINSNTTDGESTRSGALTSFDSNGWSMGGADGIISAPGNNYIGWAWRGSDSSAVSNTDGSITSSVSANTTSGFSIVKYNGNGTGGATVGHGLGVAPKAVIVKAITAGNTQNWFLNYPFGTGTGYLMLNLTNAGSGANNTVWNSTAPTSSYVTIGTSNGVNSASYEYIMYCFAEKKGFSKFGSYTGNGSADGTFVYTGFKPAFWLVKRTDTATNWFLKDSTREPFNQVDANLYPNTSGAESDGNGVDFTSNGVKNRDGGVSTNASGGTYIYMCFAENPLVGTNNIPATAR